MLRIRAPESDTKKQMLERELEVLEGQSIDIIAITDHPKIKYSLQNNARTIQFAFKRKS